MLADRPNMMRIPAQNTVDKHYPHPPDYSRKNAKTLLLGNRLQEKVYNKAGRLMEYFLKGGQTYVASIDKKTNCTVYYGYAGLAYMHIMLHLRTNRPGSREIAKSLIDHSLRHMSGKKISFLMGDSGPLAMAAVVCLMENEQRKARGFLHRLNALGDTLGKHKSRPVKEYDLMNGWAGYLYSLLFVNAYVKEAIPRNTIRSCVAKILGDGYSTARKLHLDVPLAYKSDQNYYGALQGIAGVLYMVLLSGVATPTELHNQILPTLNYLISRRYKGGNFPAYEGPVDELVQWCHGAPGFIDLLILSFDMFGGPYLQVALESGNVVWHRGLLRKGYSLCHGVCGNAYSFLSLYQKTKDVEQLYRAATYFQWSLNYPNHEDTKPEHPFSLFDGQAGIMYFLTEMASPDSAAFPCYRLQPSTY